MSNIDNKQIGDFLKKRIMEKYRSQRQFGKAYLEANNVPTDDVALGKMSNRLSQMLNGKKGIQVEDLLVFADLLEVSCEEILTAGEKHVPVSNHITNYEIAFSKDSKIWEKYMKREDNLFLNSDEYNNTVIDYALEFKNYKFIKYLMDEGFIWLVDNSDYRDMRYYYGGGTSIKKREPQNIDGALPFQIAYEDRSRTQTLALAIENKDNEVLDKLLARENPLLYHVSFLNNDREDMYQYYNEALTKAVANSDDEVLDYFSQEFEIVNDQKQKLTFIYPFIGELIEMMIGEGKVGGVEILLRKSLRHNKVTYEKLTRLMGESYKYELEQVEKKYAQAEEEYKKILIDGAKNDVLFGLNFSTKNNLVVFFYHTGKKMELFATNVVRVKLSQTTPRLKELLFEINEWADKIYALREKTEWE